MIKIGILGGAGYTAGELIRLLINHPQAEIIFVKACKDAEEYYCELIKAGWMPEEAREVLPNSLKTEIVVTANYREWRHILNLRAIGTTGRPHPQMQALMLPLLAEFKGKLPALFEDLEASQGQELAARRL